MLPFTKDIPVSVIRPVAQLAISEDGDNLLPSNYWGKRSCRYRDWANMVRRRRRKQLRHRRAALRSEIVFGLRELYNQHSTSCQSVEHETAPPSNGHTF